MATPLFNFRADEDTIDAYKEAAEREGLKPSVWAREVLGSVALGGVTMKDLTALVRARRVGTSGVQVDRHTPVHPPRVLWLQDGTVGSRDAKQQDCVHPTSAYKRLPFTIVCGACGATVRHL